ncbi:glycerol-1-phosphate dehydrogenase [Lucifera butyrica]|uniref:Glycerol-1-phosphate dehydrogenase n=1 Tax=Lucifera butyrica TaxID=1351585 RepID=A0A498R4H1_9FIRM|nr:sn-glycerol-1-phosphate dehydrogenase [Lucifera butyrica]VBB05073.1 glycerol-1-phosphate dehydrogenase [Lucifera butyrica]
MNELLQRTAAEMTKLKFPCSCGKTHTVDIENVRIGSNILAAVTEPLQSFANDTVLLVADVNTYEAGGKEVEAILSQAFRLQKVIFPDKHLVPDEKAVHRLEEAVNSSTTAMVAVGSGTLNDLTRYVSWKTKIPYIIVCTAPSMDGYASMVSPLIVNGVKVTYPAVYPYAIVADIAVMKKAPLHMLHAGLGDIIGKYTALADWKMANLLYGEYYCETTVELVEKAIEKCVSSAAGIKERSTAAIGNIIEGLVLSGMCIGMTGSSRPASGSEHLLSHDWEMLGLMHGRETHLHGNQVAIGTEIILHIYQYLAELNIDEVLRAKKYQAVTREKWAKNLVQLFGDVAPEIMRRKEAYLSFEEAVREKNAQHIRGKWELLRKNVFLAMPSPQFYRETMARAGSTLAPADLKLDRESFRLSLITAKDIRERYGVLQLLEDLGILEDTVAMITDIYY